MTRMAGGAPSPLTPAISSGGGGAPGGGRPRGVVGGPPQPRPGEPVQPVDHGIAAAAALVARRQVDRDLAAGGMTQRVVAQGFAFKLLDHDPAGESHPLVAPFMVSRSIALGRRAPVWRRFPWW